MFSVQRFSFRTAAASSALCAFSRRRLCASSPVSGVPLAPSLPVLACAPAALAAVLRAVRAGFFGSPRHLTRLPMRRFGGAGAPFSTPVRAGSRIFRVFAVRAARSLRAFKTLLRALCAASGARFPVLKCPTLFAPLALTRCGRLARRVFPGCKCDVHRRRPQHHPNINFTPFVQAVKVKPLCGCSANLDSLFKSRMGLLQVVVLRCVIRKVLTPFPFPQRGKHGSQDKGAAFRPLQALHATTQKQIFCIIRGIIVACGARGFSPEPTPNYKLREAVLKSVYGFTPYKIIRVFVQ